MERFDAQQSVEDANRLASRTASGTSLAFFPEGTFTRAAGLSPFHLGAFVAAVRARVTVLPVAIRGTRAMLRGGQWIPRRGTVAVTVSEPLPWRGDAVDEFAAVIVVRDEARKAILRLRRAWCGANIERVTLLFGRLRSREVSVGVARPA